MRGLDPYRKNDVWSSTDGKTWTQETGNAGFSGHSAVVFDKKMWLWAIGGNDNGSRKNDVWY